MLGVAIGTLFVAVAAAAWTGPTSGPPNGNVAAPLNVGSINQLKDGNLGVNGLAVFGNSLLQANSFLNWGSVSGASGYGIRDNGGTLEFKNSGGSWSSIQSAIYNLLPNNQPDWIHPSYYDASDSGNKIVNKGVHALCVLSTEGEGGSCGRCAVRRNTDGTWNLDQASCDNHAFEWSSATCF